jgi:hypothetical protein
MASIRTSAIGWRAKENADFRLLRRRRSAAACYIIIHSVTVRRWVSLLSFFKVDCSGVPEWTSSVCQKARGCRSSVSQMSPQNDSFLRQTFAMQQLPGFADLVAPSRKSKVTRHRPYLAVWWKAGWYLRQYGHLTLEDPNGNARTSILYRPLARDRATR